MKLSDKLEGMVGVGVVGGGGGGGGGEGGAGVVGDGAVGRACGGVGVLGKRRSGGSGYRPLKTGTQQSGKTGVGEDGREAPTPGV